ncbi:hypothetical protein GCM10022379_23650 [Micromonospora maritima]
MPGSLPHPTDIPPPLFSRDGDPSSTPITRVSAETTHDVLPLEKRVRTARSEEILEGIGPSGGPFVPRSRGLRTATSTSDDGERQEVGVPV